MLTIFSIPKAFEGHSGIIQTNALVSWMKLSPACQVILCGDDPGVAEVAEKHGAVHLSDIERTLLGTPLLSSAFKQAAAIAAYPRICYVNADIILFNSFVSAVNLVQLPDYLIVGQRYDTHVNELVNFEHPDWEAHLRANALDNGQLHGPTGMDFFVYPVSSPLLAIPDFAVGRPGWDNWMVDHALQLKIPVVDITRQVIVLHQNHDYKHVPRATGQAWEGPEADANRRLLGCRRWIPPDIRDATHLLNETTTVRAVSPAHQLRRIQQHAITKRVYDTLRSTKRTISGRR